MRVRLLAPILLLILSLSYSTVTAQSATPTTEPERKTDYFERIYFSGLNHAGIKGLYRASIQELQEKELSPAATRQYELLVALEKNVMDASDACDALEIVGAAIYELDAATALKQQVKQPTEKAKGNIQTAATSIMNRNADGSSKIYRTGNSVSQSVNTFNDIKSLFPPKDKPCKRITAKVVQIGFHPTPAEVAQNETKEIAGKKYQTQSIITIKNINFTQLTDIKDKLKKSEGIVEVKNNEFKNSIVILEIMHNLDIEDVINQIINQKKSYKIEVESIEGNDGVLFIK